MATVMMRNGHDSLPRTKKRLIVCCDGTWMDSDKGYAKPDKQHPLGGLQSPSNVTRISRCFKRRCSDGTLQVMSYESGVGTGGAIDTLTGGLFGQGLSERVREAYSYLCANYADGDEIVLVGFSRGAFTVRSVAGMVDNLGLLTREGVESFYPIFKDMQNWREPNYQDPFPTNPFPRKPKGPGAADEYRRRLEERGLTRVCQQNGRLITIKAVGVWDTVGSLGIPQVSWLNKLGYRPANEEYRWHDTGLSDCIEHAFQALALDETRSPFSPAVWERRSRNKPTTDLRQVWFAGNHGNCGGGWDDQSMSNITLAWMMDQLASVGVEFDTPSLERIFDLTVQFFEDQAHQDDASGVPPGPKWAINPIYRNNAPVRPWSLGAIQSTTGMLTKLSGTSPRTPGLYRQSGHRDGRFLQDTNERIHSSVRTRLACQGLGLNDKGVWTCPALGPWRLRRSSTHFPDPIPTHPSWEMGDCDRDSRRFPGAGGQRWIWQYAGSSRDAPADPKQRIMVEEPLGPYERYLLHLSGGSPNVYEFAEAKGARRRGGGDSERTSRHESEERHSRRRRSEAVGYYDPDGRPPPERRHSSRPPERQSYGSPRFDRSPEGRRYPPDALYERRRTRRVYSEQFYDDRRR